MDLTTALELSLESALDAETELATSLALLGDLLDEDTQARLASELVARQTRTEQLRQDAALNRQADLRELLAL